jgi:hypothetical protein
VSCPAVESLHQPPPPVCKRLVAAQASRCSEFAVYCRGSGESDRIGETWWQACFGVTLTDCNPSSQAAYLPAFRGAHRRCSLVTDLDAADLRQGDDHVAAVLAGKRGGLVHPVDHPPRLPHGMLVDHVALLAREQGRPLALQPASCVTIMLSSLDYFRRGLRQYQAGETDSFPDVIDASSDISAYLGIMFDHTDQCHSLTASGTLEESEDGC